jgi:amino acid adenylation domain-containing protein
LTAEKFTQIDGDRFYSIGDVGRFDTEGNIELLGRDDFQVQVRGMRVELPEIEYYLKKFPAISDCVVVSKVIQKNLDKSLVAYLVFQENFDANDSEIRKYLNQYLPDYSIPNIFVKLDRIPTNLNGKIDRSALPDPEINKNKDLVKPRNELESSIANIWEDVLGFEVGINQDFTSLGGHSLKAVQVISRIKKICSVELPLRYIFESTTVAELAQIIEKLPQTLENPPKSIIKPRSENAKLFLSFAQERIWFLNQLEGESAAYNIPLAWRIKGQLSINILELALKEIVRRHEILRTKFISENGSPVQVVVSNIPNILSVVDLQQLPKSEQEIEVQRLLKQEVETSFNLECVPLLRVKLLQLDKQAYVLIFNVHHIVFDAWSTGIFWKELLALYQAFESGQSSPLAELPIQYADYVLWQREWFESMLLEKQLKYWQKKLADAPPLLELPYDRPRPSVQTFTGQNQSLILSQSLSQAIKKLSQQEGLTVFMTLLAAFKLLLSRLSGSKDIAIGTPIASRNRLEIEQIIGFFINTVVLRTDLNGDLTVQELLGRVREVTLEAYENQAMPFERLVQELKPERSQSYNPLFQIWFNFLNLENMELEFSGLKAEVMPIKDPLAKFDLNLYIEEGQQRIKLNWVYNADLFDAVRIQEILNQYQYILEQIVTNPQAKIDNLSLVTQQSEKRLPSPIKPLNNELGEMIHTRFSQQSQIHPEKLAIVDANSSFTYAELEERSNQLANYLLANGINNQDVIAIYANRSVNLVWVLLGIMKAGGAFMILDPAYPTTRLIDCLQIAKPSGWIELEETNHNGKLQKFVNGLSCVCSLHVTSTLSLDGISSNAPNITINPDDLAYVAFTSGSTGKPKGIKGSHKPLSHFIKWHGQQFKFHELDRFSLLSGLSHDPLLRDIFTPLCLGATLYIPEAQDIQTPGALAHWMQQQLISVSHLTPAMAELLSESSLRIPSLRYVFFGGDILTQSDVIRMKKLAPNAICVNFYGTTETPQAMGYFVVPELGKLTNNESINFKQSIPLGQGIEDVQLLILNQNQQLAGIGELGEIYVRTLYLAQGYLGAQKLTQERFIVNPFTNIEGDRLYKTGDLARYLPDGNIEYVGRIDRQVKIRGFRIELGEIEGVLLQNTQIREAVVIAREDILGSKHLVAYMVTGETVLPVSELRSFLKTKLPDYMVPSAFITLESLPLTPNGKIDRRELPAPKIQPNSETTFVKPRDDVELRLNQIWQKVLGVSSIGVKNNFFDLGGHSLVAVRLFAEIERAFGKSLPLATLFQAPTIEELANICRDRGWTAPWRSLVTIQPQGSKPPLFFVHGIYGNVLYFRELADYLGSDQPFYGLQAKGLDGKETPYTSLEEMADHYVQEIREFQPTGPYFIGGHSFGCIVAFEVAQQLYAQGQEVALLALLDQAVSRNIQVPLWDWLSGHVKNLLSLGYPEQVAYVVGRLQAKIQHKIPQQIRQFYKNLGDKEVAEHKERFNTVMQANIQAINDYELQVYPGKVTLFRAKIGSPRRYALDPIGGWGEFALGGVDAIDVPGDHMTLIKEPHLPVLAAKLKACLDKAQDNKFNE